MAEGNESRAALRPLLENGDLTLVQIKNHADSSSQMRSACESGPVVAVWYDVEHGVRICAIEMVSRWM